MPEESFYNYSILQRFCKKKQEAQLDTMVHSLQNRYQWLLSLFGEPGEVTHDRLVVSGPPSALLVLTLTAAAWSASLEEASLEEAGQRPLGRWAATIRALGSAR